ncbi:hypothetical protein C1M51_02915 [Methylibium sp. Pch-M]|nr:hypothetical protein C1M51_02915 [Methylibium sp. Pch-M]
MSEAVKYGVRGACSWQTNSNLPPIEGLIHETILFSARATINDRCTIEITNGSGWMPHFPGGSYKPIDGIAIVVWRDGVWAKDTYEEALKPRFVDILSSIAEEIARLSAPETERRLATQEEFLRAERIALAKAAGGAK